MGQVKSEGSALAFVNVPLTSAPMNHVSFLKVPLSNAALCEWQVPVAEVPHLLSHTALMRQLILITASFVDLFVFPTLLSLRLVVVVCWCRCTDSLIVAAFGYIYNRRIDTNRKWAFQANLSHTIAHSP